MSRTAYWKEIEKLYMIKPKKIKKSRLARRSDSVKLSAPKKTVKKKTITTKPKGKK